jgi:hypothetical protein
MIVSLADAVAQAIGTDITLTSTIRVDVCRRQDPRANGIVVTPYSAQDHEASTYSVQRLQLAIYHTDLEAALDLGEQLRAGIMDLYGELDGRFATWTISQAWEAVHVRCDPLVYVGTIPGEKANPETHKLTLTLSMIARRIIAD